MPHVKFDVFRQGLIYEPSPTTILIAASAECQQEGILDNLDNGLNHLSFWVAAKPRTEKTANEARIVIPTMALANATAHASFGGECTAKNRWTQTQMFECVLGCEPISQALFPVSFDESQKKTSMTSAE